MNQKGFFQLFFILILLAGIGIAVYLTQFTQIFKPKAAEPALAQTLAKYGSTPLSEAVNYPKPSDHVQIGGNLDMADYNRANSFKNYIAYEFDYFWYNPGTWAGKSQFPSSIDDYNQLWQLIAEIKTINPKSKQGLYVGGVLSPDSYYWPYLLLKDRGDLVLHHPDGTTIDKTPDGRNLRLMNLFNPNTVEEMSNFWKNIYLTKKIDGLLIDGFDPYYNRDWLNAPFTTARSGLGLSTGCLEGPCQSTSYWTNNMAAFTTRLSQVSESVGADIFSNGLFWAPQTDPNDPEASVKYQFRGVVASNFANYNTGVLSETFQEVYVNPERFKDHLEGMQNVLNKGKKLFVFVMPKIMPGYKDNVGDAKNNLDMQRFFLGSYLLIQRNPYTYFGYHPGDPYRAYEEATGISEMFFYKDWNLDFGKPAAPHQSGYEVTANGLYYRGYENGVVYVNPTNQPITNGLAPQQIYLLWDPCNGTQVRDSMVFPPKSGTFLFYYTKGCNSSPTPAPSPSFNISNTTGLGNIAEGTQTFTWDKKPGAVSYVLKIDDRANAFNQLCDGNNLEGDRCETNLTSNFYTFNFIKDQTYILQVFQKDASGTQLGDPISAQVKADILTSPSPSASAKPGDTDNDNDIDIFDYNTVVTDFGKRNDPNTKADLDDDNDVDIFDYNIVVTNFGK